MFDIYTLLKCYIKHLENKNENISQKIVTGLGPLQVCDNPVALSLSKASSSENQASAWHLVGFWKPVPNAGLPHHKGRS